MALARTGAAPYPSDMPEAWRLPNLGLLELAAAALLLAGCGTSVAPVVAVAVIDGEAGPFASGVRLSASGQLVRSATAAGLVGLDEQGRAVPGLADRWIVTDDGLSYIFRLRDFRPKVRAKVCAKR